MDMKELGAEIASLKRSALQKIKSIDAVDELVSYRRAILDKGSEIANYFSRITELDSSERAAFGNLINTTKQELEHAFDHSQEALIQRTAMMQDVKRDIDLSAPKQINQPEVPRLSLNGNIHPIRYELNRMLDIFRTMGFSIFEVREIDSDYYVFDTLGLPKNHPARENWDTFRTEEGLLPTPHTSNMQVRIMRLLKTVPMRGVIYGKCFRNEATDAVHGHTFYQIEGVYVDEGISVSDMIGTIKSYLESFFERQIVWKIQPGYFPFVEPGIEFMIQCVFCSGKGCVDCKHSGWLEVMGAGMIHPSVLKEGGIDPQKYTGFAWGLGLDRLVLQKNGIVDIRSLYGSDIRFLQHSV